MDEMICYLNGHPEIVRIVLLIGEGYRYGQLRDLLKHTVLKEISVVNTCFENQIRDMKEELALKSAITGAATTAQIHFFEYYDFVWEAYKEHTSYIQIRTQRPGRDDQILEWQRQEKNDVELSVILPMYNVETYLEPCLKSVTVWSAPYVEFLFVNDGSTDHSGDIVREWAARDARIRLLEKPSGGCASAGQYGMEHARGRYVGFVDPDDFIDESMFRKLLKAAMTGSYDISYCGYNAYREDTGKERMTDALGQPYCDGTLDLSRIRELIYCSCTAIWRCLYRKEMLENAGIHFYTDLRRFDDLPFQIETFAAARSVIAVPEYLYYHRQECTGLDVAVDDDRWFVHFDVFRHLNESIASQYIRELTDCLQMAKVQAHQWALGRIGQESREEYLARALADLHTTGDDARTCRQLRERIGQEAAEEYQKLFVNKSERNQNT